MQILKKMAKEGAAVHYEEDFFHSLEAHLNYFRNKASTRVVDIEIEKASRYDGDFYSLLRDVDIPQCYHWFILRLNGMVGPGEYNCDKLRLLVPSEDDLISIRTIHKATSTMAV